MDYFLITILLIVAILTIIVFIDQCSYREKFSEDQATYRVTFTSNWGKDPLINHPPNPHTGNMFLVTHSNGFKLFEYGKLASKGVSTTSMYGTLDELFHITKGNENVGNIVTSNVLQTPGETNLMIDVTPDKRYLSFVTMIAPSSDWFTGFSSIDLKKNGEWVNSTTISLYVYVAGTDSNQGFTTEHKVRENALPITIKTDSFLYPKNTIKPIANVKITRIK